MSKSYMKYKKSDPFYKREVEKYENPIPSREFILEYMEEYGKPISRKQLREAFGIKKEDQKEALRRRLIAMTRDGQLFSNRRGLYALVNQMDSLRAYILSHPDGFGFARPENGDKDIYLSPWQMRSLFPSDKVLVQVVQKEGRSRKEGIVVEILERNTEQVVGHYQEENGLCFVEPENKQITQTVLILPDKVGKAKPGQLVVANILTYPTMKHQATGEVTEILGDHMRPGLEADIAIRSFNIPYRWDESVEEEIKKIDLEIKPEERKKRKDLSALDFVTIDGEDAKDFDDAVYCETLKEKKGWRLWVAIADVSHYVKPHTALDAEAQKRGNSVYFPNKVVPMLPEILSNHTCSLRPKEEKLTVVCEMHISEHGALLSYDFYRAVICSKARLTYVEVANMLDSEKALKSTAFVFPMLQDLLKLYKTLHKNREKRGALDFDTMETKIAFNEAGKIKVIEPVERNVAHKMIEECMLIANLATASYLSQHKALTLYRVHEGPDPEKLDNLRDLLKLLGLRLTGGKTPTTLDFAKLLERTHNRLDTHLIQTVILRSMQQAVYSPENKGHFGLAYESYLHFTSPIRRYPDLIVHRCIGHILDKTSGFEEKEKIRALGEHCSMTERRADDATRDATAWLKCEYMLDKQGQKFKGIITGVTNFGLFVELQNIYVEGLIHVTSLPNDYYHFDPIQHTLIGKRTGKTYRLGTSVMVQVVGVSLESRQIDLDWVEK
jgi:ribonuclease R